MIHLTNSLKNIFAKTNLTHKNMLKAIKSRTAIDIASLDKNTFFHTSRSCARIRKLPVHDNTIHVVKSEILTGHEEKCNLHIILKIIFHCIFIGKSCIFSNLYNEL